MDSQSLPGGIEFQRKAEQKRPSMAPERQMVRGPLDPMSIRTPHVPLSLLYSHTSLDLRPARRHFSILFGTSRSRLASDLARDREVTRKSSIMIIKSIASHGLQHFSRN